jgi:hypothetical protein
MTKAELLLYDLPPWAEYVRIGWLQTIIGRALAWHVLRKWTRYQRRLAWAAQLRAWVEEEHPHG